MTTASTAMTPIVRTVFVRGRTRETWWHDLCGDKLPPGGVPAVGPYPPQPAGGRSGGGKLRPTTAPAGQEFRRYWSDHEVHQRTTGTKDYHPPRRRPHDHLP